MTDHLDSRKKQILRIVVHDYVERAEPVASEQIAQRYDLGVKQATIRNELAEMSDLGYLKQPHVSAGRIPSDQGYRYFVDNLLPQEVELTEPSPHLPRCIETEDLEAVVSHACRVLSGLTEYTSVATQESPTKTRIQHIHLAPVTERRLVMLVVLSNGQVEHRMLEVSQPVRTASLESLSNYLMAQFSGTELARLRPKDEELLPAELQASRQLVSSILMVLRQIARDSLVTHLFVEGQIKMLNQPEFASASRFQQFLLLLDNERSLLRMISRSSSGHDPEVTIGEENIWEPMRELSIITHSYGVGQEAFGRIGVIGPTRMDYPKALRAVRAVARKLSEILGRVVSG